MASLEDEDIRKVEEQLVKAGLFTVRKAKQNAPVDTGRLRASITLADSTGIIQRPGGEAETGDSVEAPNRPGIRVGTNVDYARFIEEGTQNRPPNPFLLPAWRAAKARFNID